MMRTGFARSMVLPAVACLLAGMAATALAEDGSAAPSLSESPLTGVELSGYWRHSGTSGSEWRLVLRDPTGELLRLEPVDVESVMGGPEEARPKGADLAPESSLLLDLSRPRDAEGPDTLVLSTSRTALARHLGLARALDRLNLHDLVTVSASPDLEELNFAFGAEWAGRSFLDFGRRDLAHYITGSVQLQRRSPREGDSEVSGMGGIQAYWGRAWDWEGRLQPAAAREAVAEALVEARQVVAAEENLGDPAVIGHVVAAARRVPAWSASAEDLDRLAKLVGPAGDDRPVAGYGEMAADRASLGVFLSALADRLAAGDGGALAEQVRSWSEDMDVFLEQRLAPTHRQHALADDALSLLSTEEPAISREQAFSRAREDLSEEDVRQRSVSLATLVQAVDPTVLAVYDRVVLAEEPVGELTEEFRDVLYTAFLELPWGPQDEWLARIAEYVTGQTIVYRPRWTCCLNAAACRNWDSEVEPAAWLELRVTWRPDPFEAYGLTLSHKRGREESDRERRVDWTSLEVSYRF